MNKACKRLIDLSDSIQTGMYNYCPSDIHDTLSFFNKKMMVDGPTVMLLDYFIYFLNNAVKNIPDPKIDVDNRFITTEMESLLNGFKSFFPNKRLFLKNQMLIYLSLKFSKSSYGAIDNILAKYKSYGFLSNFRSIIALIMFKFDSNQVITLKTFSKIAKAVENVYEIRNLDDIDNYINLAIFNSLMVLRIRLLFNCSSIIDKQQGELSFIDKLHSFNEQAQCIQYAIIGVKFERNMDKKTAKISLQNFFQYKLFYLVIKMFLQKINKEEYREPIHDKGEEICIQIRKEYLNIIGFEEFSAIFSESAKAERVYTEIVRDKYLFEFHLVYLYFDLQHKQLIGKREFVKEMYEILLRLVKKIERGYFSTVCLTTVNFLISQFYLEKADPYSIRHFINKEVIPLLYYEVFKNHSRHEQSLLEMLNKVPGVNLLDLCLFLIRKNKIDILVGVVKDRVFRLTAHEFDHSSRALYYKQLYIEVLFVLEERSDLPFFRNELEHLSYWIKEKGVAKSPIESIFLKHKLKWKRWVLTLFDKKNSVRIHEALIKTVLSLRYDLLTIFKDHIVLDGTFKDFWKSFKTQRNMLKNFMSSNNSFPYDEFICFIHKIYLICQIYRLEINTCFLTRLIFIFVGMIWKDDIKLFELWFLKTVHNENRNYPPYISCVDIEKIRKNLSNSSETITYDKTLSHTDIDLLLTRIRFFMTHNKDSNKHFMEKYCADLSVFINMLNKKFNKNTANKVEFIFFLRLLFLNLDQCYNRIYTKKFISEVLYILSFLKDMINKMNTRGLFFLEIGKEVSNISLQALDLGFSSIYDNDINVIFYQRHYGLLIQLELLKGYNKMIKRLYAMSEFNSSLIYTNTLEKQASKIKCFGYLVKAYTNKHNIIGKSSFKIDNCIAPFFEFSESISSSKNLNTMLEMYKTQLFNNFDISDQFFCKHVFKLGINILLEKIAKKQALHLGFSLDISKNMKLQSLLKKKTVFKLYEDQVSLKIKKMKDFCPLFNFYIKAFKQSQEDMPIFKIDNYGSAAGLDNFFEALTTELNINGLKNQCFFIKFLFFKVSLSFQTFCYYFNKKENDKNEMPHLLNYFSIFFSLFKRAVNFDLISLATDLLSYCLSTQVVINSIYIDDLKRIAHCKDHSCEFCSSTLYADDDRIEQSFVYSVISFINLNFDFDYKYKKYFADYTERSKRRKTLRRMSLKNVSDVKEFNTHCVFLERSANKQFYNELHCRNGNYTYVNPIRDKVETTALLSFEWAFDMRKQMLVIFNYNFSDLSLCCFRIMNNPNLM